MSSMHNGALRMMYPASNSSQKALQLKFGKVPVPQGQVKDKHSLFGLLINFSDNKLALVNFIHFWPCTFLFSWRVMTFHRFPSFFEARLGGQSREVAVGVGEENTAKREGESNFLKGDSSDIGSACHLYPW